MASPLVIADYDPDWPRLFEREAASVLASVAGVRRVEHVGSTAVPGMDAVPTIDLLAGCASPAAVEGPGLARLGYAEVGVAGGAEPARRLFWKGTEAYQTYHLHLVPDGGPFWGRSLAFRDRLRADLGLAERYAHHKRQAARQFAGDPAAYAEAKASFVDAVLSHEGDR